MTMKVPSEKCSRYEHITTIKRRSPLTFFDAKPCRVSTQVSKVQESGDIKRKYFYLKFILSFDKFG
jgi:hypothetical protein